MRAAWAALCVLVLAGCDNDGLAPAGPERELPQSYWIDPRGDAPEIDGNVYKFTVTNRSRTGLSALQTGNAWRNGNRYMLGFEFRVDPSLTYAGNDLSIAQWRDADTGRVLYDLKLDARRGVTFQGRTCQPAAELGEWQRVTVRLKWAADSTGYFEMRCGFGPVQSAPLVIARSEAATARGADCVDTGICDASPAVAFDWNVGVIADRPDRLGATGASVFVRRAVQRRLYVVFGREDSF